MEGSLYAAVNKHCRCTVLQCLRGSVWFSELLRFNAVVCVFGRLKPVLVSIFAKFIQYQVCNYTPRSACVGTVGRKAF